ncbi:MAG TPA: hypothetical protein GX010_01060 [Erysipelotrichaceae bacterium]|nr:hypothetical protein [Erysipelotrichaceae bacterium]
MRKNNVIKLSVIALLSAFALTACDSEIIAKPTGYDDNSPVVKVDDGSKEIYNNTFTDIYDSIRSGSLATNVLDQLLYQYSVSVFGNYNAVTASKISDNPYGETTLKAAVNGLDSKDNPTSGNAVTKEFIKSHSAYWTKNKAGNRVNDQYQEVEENADPSLSEYARLNNKWKTIEKRIAEKFYAAISTGSYSDRNIFEEERYMRSLAASVENNIAVLNEATPLFKGILTSKVEDFDVFNVQTEDINGSQDYILHRENYQSNAALDANENPNQDATFVEDNYIPDIYRQLLVEQYILDKSYDTLGRTSARHINVLSITKNTNYSKGAVNLMNNFIKTKIFDNARADNITLDSFKVVSNAWIGTFMSEADYNATEEYQLMKGAVPEYEVVGVNPYFKGTSYGDMMEEIEKINDNPNLSQHENAYTGTNAYTWEVGRDIKIRELQLEDYTFTGWYVKSVGVSDLPTSIKNQLFDINVANALDGDACVEYTFDGGWKTNESIDNQGSIIDVVGKIKNQFFLRNTSRIKGNPVESDILLEDGNNYYIVLVEDAIKSKNLNKANYTDANAEKLDTLENYINEIVQIVADNETYKNLSKKHWLKEMNLEYHDQVIYDYFKESFPDLFED